MTKTELRKIFIAKRNAIPEESRRQYSRMITEKINGLNAYKNADTVLSFVGVGSEVDTGEIIDNALKNGKVVAVPFLEGRKMIFKRISSLSELVTGRFGIPTAPAGSQTIHRFENCLCIVPCLSVDKDGYRLGYGGGYYDRFFTEYPNIYSAAVCFNELVSECLPHEEFDVKVNMTVTEKTETEV